MVNLLTSHISTGSMLAVAARCIFRSFSSRAKPEYKVLTFIQGFRDDVKVDDEARAGVRAEIDSNMNNISLSKLSEVLVASGYYGVLEQNQYDKILAQLSRIEPIKEDKPSVPINTKTFELMVRCGLVPGCLYGDFSPYAKRFLLRTRGKAIDSSPSQSMSSFRTQLRELLEEISSDYHKDVVVGPYHFDFVRFTEPGVSYKPPSVAPDLKLLLKKYVCVNVVDRSDLSATGTLRPAAKIRSSIINTLTPNCVSVYHSDWEQLGEDDVKAKKLYLSSLLGTSRYVN